jgi:hypothetical protein
LSCRRFQGGTMMYSEKFVACIKVNGQVLRESNGTVTIPFGSEYTILLKNLNSVRSQVKIDIDGDNVTDGWLILDANMSIDLERSIRNGNLQRGNRFKFIERTSEIEEHRGIKEDDGLIRVEYKMEKVYEARKHYYDEYIPVPKPYDPWHPYPWRDRRRWLSGERRSIYPTRSRGLGSSGGIISPQSSTTQSYSNASFTDSSECLVEPTSGGSGLNDVGITVAGSESNQQFHYVSGFETEASSVIVLKLRGQIKGKKIAKPLTVKTKVECTSCGLTSSKGEQFCSRCGTGLVLV